jgi:hypothetical protein
MMKHIFFAVTLIALSHMSFAQKVGINNTDPQVSLDINGALAHRSVTIDPFMNNVNIPVDASFVIISNVDVTGPVSIFAPEYINGKRLVIYNNSGFTATFNSSVTIQSGETKEFIGLNPGGYKLITQASQLEKITEGGHTGWRLLGSDPANFGDIGIGAVDLSISDNTPSTFYGATGGIAVAMGYGTMASGAISTAMGDQSIASGEYGATALGSNTEASGIYGATALGYFSTASGSASTSLGASTIASGSVSTAMGYNTRASGNYGATAMGYFTNAIGDDGATAMGYGTIARAYSSLATGRYNDTIAGSSKTIWVTTDPLLTVGNGTSNSVRSNAMTIYKNGTFNLQNHTSIPDNSSDKFYVLNGEPYFGTQKLQSSQLEKITEGGNTGWRLLGQDPSNYGNIGDGAVDLSINSLTSSTSGATGNYSMAMGIYTTASGNYGATALGDITIASGDY